MQLSIVTPLGVKVVSDVSSLTAPGEIGELTILPGHRPLMTSLGIGLTTYTGTDKRVRRLATSGGYLEIHEDEITMVVESAETPDEVDVARAKVAYEEAERALRESVEADQFDRIAKRRDRALNRLAASRHATPEVLKKNAQEEV